MASDVRRFKPELVESSSRTSKPQNVQHADESQGPPSVSDHQQPKQSPTSNEPEQRCSDIPVTSSAAAGKSRRFLPQPTETSSRSSKQSLAVPKDKNDTKHASTLSHEDAPQSRRRLFEPVEVTRSNNKHNKKDAGVETGPKKEGAQTRAPRRFLAEPIETMKLSRRQPSRSDENEPSGIAAESNSPRQTLPRKFTPQLIETGKRSVRRAETLSVQAFPRITDEAQDNVNPSSRPQSPPISRGQQIAAALEPSSVPPESRFSYASLLQRQEGRRHSFRVPDLPAIPSNSSEGSNGSDTPSLSTSPSASSDASARNNLVQKIRSRESCDERFSGYLLSLASRSAEKELREQALAAFPNEQIHQPVSHFAIDGDEEFGNQDDEPMTPNEPQIFSNIGPMLRQGSTADLSWELEQMRRHKEKAELENLGVHRSNAYESRFSAAAIASRQVKRPKNESLAFQGWRRDPELHQMRHAASPPMLGDDIVFPFSVSPQGTATETDHLHVHHTEAEPGNDEDQGGLWVDRVHHGEDFEKRGLWMGLCHKEEDDEDDLLFNRVRTGIATPRPVSGFVSSTDINDLMEDDDEPLSKSIAEDMATDPRFSTDLLDIMDAKPEEDNAIEREFNDAFITQVYNYLSLGYPALARYFDHELSKISGIPVSDLRRDELHTEAKGHVVSLPNRPLDHHQPSGLSSSGVQDCMRWKALKLYIHEWARQQPGLGMINDEELDAWGVIERRGSWAI